MDTSKEIGRGIWVLLLSLLVALLVLAAIVRLLYVFWPYPKAIGIDGFRNQVLAEQRLLHHEASNPAWIRINHTQQAVQDFAFKRLGLENYLHHPQSSRFESKFMSSYVAATSGVLYYSVLQFGLRLGVVLEMLPWLILCGGIALLDGLCCRSKRRYVVAAESSFLYNKARNLASLVWLAIILYLLMPWQVPLIWLFGPAILLLFVAFHTMARYFRKYI